MSKENIALSKNICVENLKLEGVADLRIYHAPKLTLIKLSLKTQGIPVELFEDANGIAHS